MSLRSEHGMTLVELMVTVIIICVGVLATLATYVNFSDATNVARERSVLNSVAQREMEQLRAIGFDKLGMASDPSGNLEEAPLTGEAADEPSVGGGVVVPGGDAFTYQGAEGKIYRYVTARTTSCSGLTAAVQTQLAGQFLQSLSAVQATLGDLCPIVDRTRRVTIVVVSDTETTPRPIVRLSTVVRDPSFADPLGSGGLAVDSSLQNVTSVSPEGLVTQSMFLIDTRCSDSGRDTPVDHETRDTSQFGFTCAESGPAPTLMTLDGYSGSESDPVPDFSTEITRAAQGGLALLRDTAAGSCDTPSNLVYENSETEQRMRSIHTWASTPTSSAVDIGATGGRGALTLWSSTADGVKHPGRLCVTVRKASTGEVVGVSDFSLAAWPDEPTELVTAFDLTPTTLISGERLLLTLRVPADSGTDIRVLYDHVSFQSHLSLTTAAGAGF